MSDSATAPPYDVVSLLRAAGCVFAEEEAALLLAAAPEHADLVALVDRRVAGEPLEHLLGWAEFCGLRIRVDPAVFVPRRRTEFLVDEALEVTAPGAVVVDLCCGSGAIGAAVLAARASVELHVVDIHPAAAACARKNLPAGGHVYEGDLYEPLPDELRGRIDVLVANAPYVPTDALDLMPPEARLHEPRVALDGGADGLDVLRKVASDAAGWLAPGGHLLFETALRQSDAAAELVATCGLVPRVVSSAEHHSTVVVAENVVAR